MRKKARDGNEEEDEEEEAPNEFKHSSFLSRSNIELSVSIRRASHIKEMRR